MYALGPTGDLNSSIDSSKCCWTKKRVLFHSLFNKIFDMDFLIFTSFSITAAYGTAIVNSHSHSHWIIGKFKSENCFTFTLDFIRKEDYKCVASPSSTTIIIMQKKQQHHRHFCCLFSIFFSDYMRLNRALGT